MNNRTLDAEQRQRDAEARRRAQTVFDRPLVLEAGAGTGKTNTLVARLVAWCMGSGWELADAALRRHAPEPTVDVLAARVLTRVVAITFTEFAAAEMLARAGQALAQIEQGGWPVGLLPDLPPRSDAERRLRARALLGALDRLGVSTIHSFCRRLLAVHPLEAGLHPHFQIDADGMQQAEIVREVLEAHLRSDPAGAPDPLLRLLATQHPTPDEIESALAKLIDAGIGPETLAIDPCDTRQVRALGCVLRERLDALREAAQPLRVPRRETKAAAAMLGLLDETAGRIESHGLDTRTGLEALCDWLGQQWSDRTLQRLGDWEKGRFTKTEAACLGDAAVTVADRAAPLRRLIRHLRNVDPCRLDLVRHGVGTLLKEINRAMRARGVETYAALLHDARDLLCRHPDVEARVRRGIDQLLVDEFQDTDPIQCEIVRCLALDGPVAERPGLFLVGDPKQSIYGWRRADLRAYDDFVGAVVRQGGERHLLTINYRSAPAILDEVARVIGPVMQPRPGLQPAFQPLAADGDHAPEASVPTASPTPVEYWVSWGWDTRAPVPDLSRADAAELEARALARDIRRLHDEQGVSWEEIGVLFRTTGDLDVYLSAFREHAVPYAVERDQSYYRRREIIEATALVRCVLDPNDQIALLTLLRSPLVGVPDAALIPLWIRRFPAFAAGLHGASAPAFDRLHALVSDVASHLPADVPGIDRIEGWELNLLAFLHALAHLRDAFERQPADVFVERLRTGVLIEATEAARHLGEYRAANLDRLFRDLLRMLSDGRSDTQDTLRTLRRGIAERREAEEGRPKDAAEHAVRVMTIHKAKGLDFRHVYVMQLDKESARSRPRSADAGEHGQQFEYRLFGIPTPRFDEIESRREGVEAAEQVRTLYVAMTRAKERLVLAGRWPATVSPVVPERAPSQMALLQSRAPAPPDLHALMEEVAATGERCFADRAGARWVFPALDSTHEPPVTALPDASRLFDAAAAASASAALQTRCARAAARSIRPFAGTVSEEVHDISEWAPGRGARNERRPDRSSRVARAIGTAVHRALETWDWTVLTARELERQCVGLPALLRPLLATTELDVAVAGAAMLLRRFAAGPLCARFLAIADHVLARELPVLLPPEPEGTGALGFVAGAIDLLYRDPATGTLVVADYKTDAVEHPADIAARVQAYAPQGAHYVRALREGLRLPEEPRFELWFLHPGRIEAVP